MAPASPGFGERGAAVTGNHSVEGSTEGLAEVNATPNPSPEAITAPYDGETASSMGSYQSSASADIPSQYNIRRENPQVQLYQTKSLCSGRDQLSRFGEIEFGIGPSRVQGRSIEDVGHPDHSDEV